MEQKTEALYLINGDRFLHLRENGVGVGFATYDCANGAPLESGQISIRIPAWLAILASACVCCSRS